MSFEIFLRPMTGATLPSPKEVQAQLAAVAEVTTLARWAAYHNPNTGVDFQVDWSAAHICWTIPTCRARFFALEAADVLGWFCRANWLQPTWWTRTGPRPIGSLEGLEAAVVERWERSNELAVGGLGKAMDAFGHLPSHDLEWVWRANQKLAPGSAPIEVDIDGVCVPKARLLDSETFLAARSNGRAA